MRSSWSVQGLLLASLVALAPLSARADEVPSEPALTREERRAQRRAAKAQRQAAQEPQRKARSFRKLRVEDELPARVERLTSELQWHTSLEAALAEARRQRKPVLWIQALGELRGLL